MIRPISVTQVERAAGSPVAPAEHAPWPAVSSSEAHRLRDGWYATSLGRGWASAGDWWAPACDALAEALVAGRDPRPSARRLGRSRSRLGVGVEETMDDVLALWHVHARREPPTATLQAVVGGWAEAGLEPAGAASCFDAMTGLTTRAHLEARLAEMYRAGDLGGPRPGYQLVVVDVGLAGAPQPAAGAAWRQIEELCRAAEAARRAFLGGETLARLSAARIGAVASAGPQLSRRLATLEELLVAGADSEVVPTVWVEALPRTFGLVPQLLADLGR